MICSYCHEEISLVDKFVSLQFTKEGEKRYFHLKHYIKFVKFIKKSTNIINPLTMNRFFENLKIDSEIIKDLSFEQDFFADCSDITRTLLYKYWFKPSINNKIIQCKKTGKMVGLMECSKCKIVDNFDCEQEYRICFIREG